MQVKVGDILLYAFYTTSKKINNWEEIVTAQEVITYSLESEGIKDENIVMFPIKDLCEGCGEIKLIVDCVIWEQKF